MYYNLWIDGNADPLSEVAESRGVALSKFGERLGKRLTTAAPSEDPDALPPYMMKEREENMAWLGNPDIPNFEVEETG